MFHVSRILDFTPAEKDAIDAACSRRRTFKAGEALGQINETDGAALVLFRGIAAQYRVSATGERQVADLVFPGELCNLQAVLFDESDQNVTAISDGEAAELSAPTIFGLFSRHPRIAVALVYREALERSILFEHLLSVGRRPASERIAHLLTEMHLRSRYAGLSDMDGFRLPITQSWLADLLGLSTETVNRAIAEFSRRGLIEPGNKRITIRDPEGLARLARYDASYLHLDSAPAGLRELLRRDTHT